MMGSRRARTAVRRRPGAPLRLAAPALLVLAAAAPAMAQLGDAGFVPALVPHTVQQPPLLGAGFVSRDGGRGAILRGDFWLFGRIGIAASVGTDHRGGETGVHGGAAALLEVVPQGVGLKRPGVQLQAGYTTVAVAGERTWGVPVTAGILLHVPPPLSRRAHALIHPSLSVRHVVAGSARGTSGSLGLRVVLDDNAGVLTLWGLHGHVRLLSDGADRGPKWELAVMRILGRRR
jgi:hypothetical protein